MLSLSPPLLSFFLLQPLLHQSSPDVAAIVDATAAPPPLSHLEEQPSHQTISLVLFHLCSYHQTQTRDQHNFENFLVPIHVQKKKKKKRNISVRGGAEKKKRKFMMKTEK